MIESYMERPCKDFVPAALNRTMCSVCLWAKETHDLAINPIHEHTFDGDRIYCDVCHRTMEQIKKHREKMAEPDETTPCLGFCNRHGREGNVQSIHDGHPHTFDICSRCHVHRDIVAEEDPEFRRYSVDEAVKAERGRDSMNVQSGQLLRSPSFTTSLLISDDLRAEAVANVLRERSEQEERWSREHDDAHDLHMWATILASRVGKLAKASWQDYGAYASFDHNLVQIAAVALAALESLRRTKRR